MSGRKNQMLLMARSKSFKHESDAEHQTGEQYSNQGKKCIKGFEYCIIVTNGLVKFANKTSFLQ